MYSSLFITFELKMNKTEKETIQQGILEIAERTERNGRNSEVVKINVEVTLRGQEAINFKVLQLFSKHFSNEELIDYLLRIGVQEGSILTKLVALKFGIDV